MQKDAEGMANSVDSDQTSPSVQKQSDPGLHCLPRPVCLYTCILDNYDLCSFN